MQMGQIQDCSAGEAALQSCMYTIAELNPKSPKLKFLLKG